MGKEGDEPSGNDEYRGSYNSVFSQRQFEKQGQEGLPLAGSKHTIQEHVYHSLQYPEKEQLLNHRPTEHMMPRAVDHPEGSTME